MATKTGRAWLGEFFANHSLTPSLSLSLSLKIVIITQWLKLHYNLPLRFNSIPPYPHTSILWFQVWEKLRSQYPAESREEQVSKTFFKLLCFRAEAVGMATNQGSSREGFPLVRPWVRSSTRQPWVWWDRQGRCFTAWSLRYCLCVSCVCVCVCVCVCRLGIWRCCATILGWTSSKRPSSNTVCPGSGLYHTTHTHDTHTHTHTSCRESYEVGRGCSTVGAVKQVTLGA